MLPQRRRFQNRPSTKKKHWRRGRALGRAATLANAGDGREPSQRQVAATGDRPDCAAGGLPPSTAPRSAARLNAASSSRSVVRRQGRLDSQMEASLSRGPYDYRPPPHHHLRGRGDRVPLSKKKVTSDDDGEGRGKLPNEKAFKEKNFKLGVNFLIFSSQTSKAVHHLPVGEVGWVGKEMV